jgi:hypothetical protein
MHGSLDGIRVLAGSAITMSEFPPPVRRPAPLSGEHTDDGLAQIHADLVFEVK